ncbi:MAG: hypothetical protein ACE5J9_04400 [Methanosarcinales archaeon]
MPNVSEINTKLEDTNNKILEALEFVKSNASQPNTIKVETAREYFCEAFVLALEKNLEREEREQELKAMIK